MTSKRILLVFITFIFVYDCDRTLARSGTQNPPETFSNVNVSKDNIIVVKDMNKGILKEVSGEVALPDHLVPFDGQLAGHVYHKKGRNKLEFSILSDSDGNLLKPYPTKHEVDFYNTLQNTDNSLLEELKKYIPAYYGTRNINIGGEVVEFICMENILKGYIERCSMDIKFGRVRIPPGAPKRTEEQERRYIGTMNAWGFGIPAFEYYNVVKKARMREGKKFGYVLQPNKAIQTLYEFVNGKIGIQCGLVDTILTQLREIEYWFKRQRLYRFYDSSILLTYDADALVTFLDENKSNAGNKEIVACQRVVPVKVRMIDFGKVVPDTNIEEDENYLLGLRNLIYIFNNLTKFYENTRRNQTTPTPVPSVVDFNRQSSGIMVYK